LLAEARQEDGRPDLQADCGSTARAFSGVGKPEPIKHALSGYWSRRINDEHRVVYKIEGGSVLLAQLRYQY